MYNLDMSRIRLASLSLLAALLLCSPLRAQKSYYQASGGDFLKKTRFIFTGRVVDQRSFWSDDARFIMTRYTFQVSQALKGEPGGRVELVEYGGQVGEQAMRVSHTATYVEGQEYLVFSYLDLLDHNRTFAGPLGRLPVMSDRRGERTVRLYSGHPLRDVLEGDAGTLHDLEELASSLRRGIVKSHQQKERLLP